MLLSDDSILNKLENIKISMYSWHCMPVFLRVLFTGVIFSLQRQKGEENLKIISPLNVDEEQN